MSEYEMNGRTAKQRVRLARLQKPTIVKSLKNDFWYCGVHVAQGNGKFVANHWNYPLEKSSIDKTIHGRGETAQEAYRAWFASWCWAKKERPKSVPLPSNFRLTSKP